MGHVPYRGYCWNVDRYFTTTHLIPNGWSMDNDKTLTGYPLLFSING
ncbi:hypothetical protein TPY_0494 [Sulfobacillus acidophilus TPY]|nr:hypothetical protein TPY_0494 [Sulfobacillus acidophilus TPY]